MADESIAFEPADTDGGVESGAILIRYATAVHESSGVAAATDTMLSELGAAATAEAAATCAAFNGLVRVADGIGIQLDEGTEAATASSRSELGIDRFGGSANTKASGSDDVEINDIMEMFSSSG